MKKVDLSTYNNEWYSPGNPVKRALWYLFNAAFLLNPMNPFSGLKILVLRVFGAKIGSGVVIKPRVNVKYPWKLSIGNNCWIGEGVWIDNLADVTLGNNVCLSQEAFLLCGNHNYKKTTFDLIVEPIVIKDGGWVGAKAIVTPGITIEEHGVLSAGSVATQDLVAFSIYQGNPAVKKKDREIE